MLKKFLKNEKLWKSLDKVKWIIASFGWPCAFIFWFQVMVVLYSSRGLMPQISLYIFHFLWIIITCSFFQASFTPPLKCRDIVPIPENGWEGDYCDKCDYIKPKRWHHCRKCDRCVYRMDHHCPILQMCIHEDNHKFFLLFLCWPLILAIFTLSYGYYDLFMVFYSGFTFEKISTEQHYMGTGMSNSFMVGFAALYLLKFQIPNLLRNQTLIEESRDDDRFDLGDWKSNFKSIMGPFITCWLPVKNQIKKKHMKIE
ncbi:unnamed protein product [Caenorhabditis angaria]|uniref:Palmitoyltransferase n=1 Tax=Caenorhabditis angaria TaxID=860376 RepID=A0A9P1N189_9PELO|nr:unnamed protein product [Caenorhabditis angaria]